MNAAGAWYLKANMIYGKPLTIVRDGIRYLTSRITKDRWVQTPLPPKDQHEADIIRALAEEKAKGPQAPTIPQSPQQTESAAAPSTPDWKYTTYKEGIQAVSKLRSELAEKGLPQPYFDGHGRMGTVNAEVLRLEGIVANLKTISRPTPNVQKSYSQPVPVASVPMGAPGISPNVMTQNKTPLPAAAQLSRFQLLSALDLFPAVEVTGAEDDSTLAVMLKNASAEAGLRLPGQSTEPTPGELRQAKLNEILAAPAATVSAGAWNIESLSALVDAIFGPGTAKMETQRASEYAVGEASLAAKLNSHPPYSHQWHRTMVEMKQAARQTLAAAHSPEAQKAKIENLRTFLFKSGLNVPGLSFNGLRIPDDATGRLPPRQRAIAQSRADTFCAVLSGDESAGRSMSPEAAAARKHISSVTKKPFCLGMTAIPKSRAEIDAAKYPYSNISPSGI
jgi:hypothetical protein